MQEILEKPEELHSFQLFVNGTWRDGSSKKTIPIINPFSEKTWAQVAEAEADDVSAAAQSARRAFDDSWKDLSPAKRSRFLWKIGDLIEENGNELARLDAMCSGKLVREMLAQMKAITGYWHYYAGLADKIEGEVIPLDDTNILNYTFREPVGVVGIIVPWNSPLLALTEWLAPAMACGNSVVVKPSELTPVTALILAQLTEEAGIPRGVYNVVPGYGETTGQALVKHPQVTKVVFTGGTETGREIIRASAENNTRLSLELGGKSPQIVFEDADLSRALDGVTAGIFAATGQSCVAGSRLFVHEEIYDEFLPELVKLAERIKLGNPLSQETEMGPLVSKQQLERVTKYVNIGLGEGARLECGGKAPSKDLFPTGYFFLPTILSNVTNKMQVCQDEIFGPVLCAMKFKDENQILLEANDTRYGLAAGIWTRDVKRAHRFAKRIDAGTVWINTYRTLSHSSPFGGYKASGYGRQCGLEVVKEFTQVKSIMVETSENRQDPFASKHA